MSKEIVVEVADTSVWSGGLPIGGTRQRLLVRVVDGFRVDEAIRLCSDTNRVSQQSLVGGIPVTLRDRVTVLSVDADRVVWVCVEAQVMGSVMPGPVWRQVDGVYGGPLVEFQAFLGERAAWARENEPRAVVYVRTVAANRNAISTVAAIDYFEIQQGGTERAGRVWLNVANDLRVDIPKFGGCAQAFCQPAILAEVIQRQFGEKWGLVGDMAFVPTRPMPVFSGDDGGDYVTIPPLVGLGLKSQL